MAESHPEPPLVRCDVLLAIPPARDTTDGEPTILGDTSITATPQMVVCVLRALAEDVEARYGVKDSAVPC